MDKENDVAAAISLGKKRLVTDSMSEWASRLERFMNAKPDARGTVTVSDLVIPKESGASSGTIVFTASYGNVGETEKFVLRFHTEASHANYCDIPGQYKLLCALQQTSVLSPRVTDMDETGEHLGVPGFLMKCVAGTVLPPTYPLNGPLFDVTPDARRQMVREAVAGLVELHRVDWRGFKLDKITRKGAGRNFLESDINWYWKALNWGTPEHAPVVGDTRQWLLDHQFEPQTLAICHGDASLHNYMYRDNHLVAMLDWEFAFIGAPELDVAFQSSAHEVLSIGTEPLAGVPDIVERKAIYEELTGRPLHNWDYYETIGHYKIYIHMALSFRNCPESLRPARDKYINFAAARMNAAWDAARK